VADRHMIPIPLGCICDRPLEHLAAVDDLLVDDPQRPSSELPPFSSLSWILELLEDPLEDGFDYVVDVGRVILVGVFLPDVLGPITVRLAATEK